MMKEKILDVSESLGKSCCLPCFPSISLYSSFALFGGKIFNEQLVFGNPKIEKYGIPLSLGGYDFKRKRILIFKANTLNDVFPVPSSAQCFNVYLNFVKSQCWVERDFHIDFEGKSEVGFLNGANLEKGLYRPDSIILQLRHGFHWVFFDVT